MNTSLLTSTVTAITDRANQHARQRDPNRPDFTGEDGFLHCGVCGQPKQTRIRILGRDMVVPCICQCRQDELDAAKKQDEYQRAMDRIDRLHSASLMSSRLRDAVFDRYSIRPENERPYRIARRYVDRFDDMSARNQGLLFYGDVGTGKSFTAACIANALLAKSVPVVMTSFVKILQDVQSNGLDETSYLRILDRAKLLILDDLGAERSTDYALEKVYNVIDSRVRTGLPMILTTNLSLEDISDHTGPQSDIRYHRIYDRVLETCYPVQFTGESFRMATASRRMTDVRALLEGPS